MPSLSLIKQMPPGGYVPALDRCQVAQSMVRGSAEVALCQRCTRTEGTRPVATEQEAKGSWQTGQGLKVGQGHPQLCGA